MTVIKDKVFRYLVTRQGELVFLSTMSDELGLPERSIQNVMYRIKGTHPDMFSTAVRGRAWQVNMPSTTPTPQPYFGGAIEKAPGKSPEIVHDVVSAYPKALQNAAYGKSQKLEEPKEPRLFDEIGRSKDGDIIVMDKDNNLYRLDPI